MHRVKFRGLLKTLEGGVEEVLEAYPFLRRVNLLGVDAADAISLLPGASERYEREEYESVVETSLTALVSLQRALRSKGRVTSPEVVRALEGIAAAARLFEKASQWLGKGDWGKVSSLSVFRDLAVVHSALKDSEALAGLETSLAYAYLRRGQVAETIQHLGRGEQLSRAPGSRMLLAEAKANLAQSFRQWSTAEHLYRRTLDLQEETGTTDASRGLTVGKHGIVLARTAGASRFSRGIRLAEEGLSQVERAKHSGFGRMLSCDLAELLLDRGDTDAAVAILEKFRPFPRRPYLGSVSRLDAVLGLAALLRGERPTFRPSVSAADSDRYLVGALESCTRAIVQNELHRAAESLCVAAEIVTNRVVERPEVGPTPSVQFASLTKKADLLQSSGLMSSETADELRQLARLRNRLFHGKGEEPAVSLHLSRVRLARRLLWLYQLIEAYETFLSRPLKKTKEMEVQAFLLGGR